VVPHGSAGRKRVDDGKTLQLQVIDGAKANIGNANEFHGRQHHPFTREMGLAQKIPV
jgi:hypothetical protein